MRCSELLQPSRWLPPASAFPPPCSQRASVAELGVVRPHHTATSERLPLMPRYVAFLRGVSPMNATMPALKACFATAGFADVRTLLSSGNIVFDARSSSQAALERRAEKAMQSELGHGFATFVRPAEYLQNFLEADPFAKFNLPASAKRVVTFLRSPARRSLELPLEQDGASILAVTGSEALSAYVPGPKGPVFMHLLEQTFGTSITTRTLDTVRKCARA